MNLTEHLKTQRYPGRFVVIGKTEAGVMGIYGVTGRRDSSQARYLESRGDNVLVLPTDTAIMKQGNPELLTYRAVRPVGADTLIANARHIEKADPKRLTETLLNETSEPDDNKTPRITGAVLWDKNTPQAKLHLIRGEINQPHHSTWAVPLERGKGTYISTYTGDDVEPAASFRGAPVQVSMNFKGAREAAQKTYDALAPKPGEKDYRVGVVAVLMKGPGEREVAIVNRHSTG